MKLEISHLPPPQGAGLRLEEIGHTPLAPNNYWA